MQTRILEPILAAVLSALLTVAAAARPVTGAAPAGPPKAPSGPTRVEPPLQPVVPSTLAEQPPGRAERYRAPEGSRKSSSWRSDPARKSSSPKRSSAKPRPGCGRPDSRLRRRPFKCTATGRSQRLRGGTCRKLSRSIRQGWERPRNSWPPRNDWPDSKRPSPVPTRRLR